jgi:DNA replication protein DnaC
MPNDGTGIYDREIEEWAPCPPTSMVMRHMRWMSRHVYDRVADSAYRNAFACVSTLSRWAVNATADERRAAMSRAFIEPSESCEPRGSGNLIFAGPTGCGKTVAVAHLMMSIWGRGLVERRAWSAAKLFKATTIANARRNAKLGQEAEILDEAKQISLLILDDVGQGDDRDSALFEVIDHRYDEQKPSIVTTGLTTPQLTERYGEHFVRRLVQTGTSGRIISVFPKKGVSNV